MCESEELALLFSGLFHRPCC